MMDKGWIKTKLGECAIINADTYNPKEGWPFINYLETGQITDNIISDIHYYITSEDKIPASARRKIRKGDIVYSTVRPNKNHFGIIKNCPDNFLVSTAFAVIRGRPNLADTSFIYYYITQKSIINFFHTLAEHSSSAYPSLQMNDIEIFEITLPPIKEQKAIAHILGSLDDKIELNRRMNETLEEMAKGLFKSWFVDFDPVRAKIDGRWQPGQSLTGLPAELYDLFPDRLVSSELGEIPEWWQVYTVGDCATIKGGKQIKRTEFDDNADFPIFGGAGQMGFTTKYNADGYVITVGRVGAYCGNFVAYRGKAWVNNNASRVTALEHIPSEWLFLSLRELDMETIKKGAAQPFVSNGDIAKMKMVVPDKEILSYFQKLVKPIMLRREFNDDETATLIQIRDTLLPKLISGEIRVDELDIEL